MFDIYPAYATIITTTSAIATIEETTIQLEQAIEKVYRQVLTFRLRGSIPLISLTLIANQSESSPLSKEIMKANASLLTLRSWGRNVDVSLFFTRHPSLCINLDSERQQLTSLADKLIARYEEHISGKTDHDNVT